MSYVLDTNACIALIKSQPESVRRRFEIELDAGSEIFASSVAVFELFYGIMKSSRPDANERSFTALISSLSSTLSFDLEDAKVAGRIRAELEMAGTPIGAYDYLLAGQALNRGLTLVTANEREFRRVNGLRWENWAK
jgi:tRNA(fMet)-specific endonuclease VapC